jgi:hypothetical protein
MLTIVSASLVFAAAEDFPAFRDVAAKVGITLLNISGGANKDYILEAVSRKSQGTLRGIF